MKRFLNIGLAVLLIFAAGGCESDDDIIGDITGDDIKVMTWNIYVGADTDPITMAQSVEDIPVEVLYALLDLVANNFKERVNAIADEIEAERPHLIGLQEVSIIRNQSPGDYLIGNPIDATNELYNYLDLLLEALEARGLSYEAVAVSKLFDIELPMITDPQAMTFDDVRLTDHEVLLARSDVEIGNIVEGQYNYNLGIQLPTGASITVQRGWVAANATINGKEFRIVSTHLETAEASPTTQLSQAAELISMLSSETLPIVLVGDMNSDADGSTTASIANLLAAGYVDAWTESGTTEAEYTCCQLELLASDSSNLSRRIDYILLSDVFEVVKMNRVGADLEDRSAPSGLWPSDHAGLVATIRLP